jgi:dTDP-4-amino-4,6-dideoxygalactose transaminase
VVTVANTFAATGEAILLNGARPVWVDVDPVTYTMDPDHLEAAITARTKVIIPVHLYGHPADMKAICEIAGRHGIPVLEDAAQAHGAELDGRRAGSLGHAACFSFYPGKNLGAYGDAGMAVTCSEEIAGLLDVLRRHGGRVKYYHERIGYNSRLDEMQAAILRVKLRHLDEWTAARRRVAARYDELLAGTPVTTPYQAPDIKHVFHQYTIRAPQRDELEAFLKGRGIGTMIYYPVPLHRQEIYADLGQGPGSLPEAERAAQEVLSLPIYPELTDGQIEEVATAIRQFYNS